MKLKVILFLSLVLLTLLPTSCVTSHDIHVELTCDDFTEHPNSIRNDLEIEVGDKIYVELCSNPTTGFEWSYQLDGDKAVREEDYDYSAPDSDVTGTPGKETWTFEGIAKGESEIFLEYSQPWNGGIKQERTYKLKVQVK